MTDRSRLLPLVATHARSYAHSYARVASPSTSTDSFDGGASATRRWTAEERKANLASAPPFAHPPPLEALLRELVAGYERITADLVRSDAKRNLVATCYRIHGEAFLDLLQTSFAETRSAVNLLGRIRCLAPATPTDDAEAADPADGANDELPDSTSSTSEGRLSGLTYAASERPEFDGASQRRYDRRPSNPDAFGLFGDEELSFRGRSSADRALSR